MYSNKWTCLKTSILGDQAFEASVLSITTDISLSYSYDLTSTLQHNLTSPSRLAEQKWPFRDRYAWNFHLLSAPFSNVDCPSIKPHWLLPLVHGHVDQASKY